MIRPIHLTCAIVLLATALTYADRGVSVARTGLPATVMVTALDESGRPTAFGSGFLAGDSTIATNLHVIENAHALTITLIGDGSEHPVDHIRAVDSKNDLAILHVGEIHLKPIGIPEVLSVEIGSNVFALGNPRGLDGTISNGIVSAVRKIEGRELIQHTAPISSGSSGGPILNEEGDLVGIAVSSLTKGQNLNFAVPAKFLANLLNVADQKIKVSSLDVQEPNYISPDQILVSELWDSIYSIALFEERNLILERNWMERLGYFRCIVNLDNLDFEHASVVAINSGPFSGTHKVSIPSVRPITYELWESRTDTPLGETPDRVTQEGDIQFHCLSFEKAAASVTELKRLSTRERSTN
jgi:hypothetical protein